VDFGAFELFAAVLQLDQSQEARISAENILSEVLVQPHLNATIDLSRFNRIKDTIPRFEKMSQDEFNGGWHTKPFILTNVVEKWPAFKKWTIDYLLQQFPASDATFQIESVKWSLPTYVEYMNSNRDESPLYLFDKDFATKATASSITLQEDYSIPETFREDLFTLLGEARPDHRWLIVGPKRSGSMFHKVLPMHYILTAGPQRHECLECRCHQIKTMDSVSSKRLASRSIC
jgi:hypothetical protein